MSPFETSPRHVPEVELGGAKGKEMRQRPEKAGLCTKNSHGSQLARRI